MRQDLCANCEYSTYIDSLHPNFNISTEESILVGSIFNPKYGKYNIFISLLKFVLPEINPAEVESATLYLYVENFKLNNKTFENIVIYQNISNIPPSPDINNMPELSGNNFYKASLSLNNITSYIKVNITQTFISWLESDNNFGLTLTALSNNSVNLIQFASFNSSKAPYISVTLKTNEYYHTEGESNDRDSLENVKAPYYEDNCKNSYNSKQYLNSSSSSPSSKDDFNYLLSSTTIDNKLKYLSQSLNQMKYNFSAEINNIKDYLNSPNNSSNNINKITFNLNKKIDNLDKKYSNLIKSLNNSIEDLSHCTVQTNNSNESSYYDDIEHLREEIKSLKDIINEITIEPIN